MQKDKRGPGRPIGSKNRRAAQRKYEPNPEKRGGAAGVSVSLDRETQAALTESGKGPADFVRHLYRSSASAATILQMKDEIAALIDERLPPRAPPNIQAVISAELTTPPLNRTPEYEEASLAIRRIDGFLSNLDEWLQLIALGERIIRLTGAHPALEYRGDIEHCLNGDYRGEWLVFKTNLLDMLIQENPSMVLETLRFRQSQTKLGTITALSEFSPNWFLRVAAVSFTLSDCIGKWDEHANTEPAPTVPLTPLQAIAAFLKRMISLRRE